MKTDEERQRILSIANEIYESMRKVRDSDAMYHACHEFAQRIVEGKIQTIQEKR